MPGKNYQLIVPLVRKVSYWAVRSCGSRCLNSFHLFNLALVRRLVPRMLKEKLEDDLKATVNILNLLAFLLGSPDYAQPHALAFQKPRPVAARTNPPSETRLAKRAAAN
jgi:hypothetical protein